MDAFGEIDDDFVECDAVVRRKVTLEGNLLDKPNPSVFEKPFHIPHSST